MRKNLWLMIALGLLLHKSYAQSQLSMQQYYYMGAGTPLNPTPIAGFQMNNGFYAEGRYNYEDVNTFSMYLGKTFAKEAKLSYSISPMAGAVIGSLNGGSLAANISLGYKNFYVYSQPQYTFSLQNSVNNYIYTWTDFTYSPLDWLSAGISVQHTKPHYEKAIIEKGIVAEFAFKKLTFPFYVFNPHTSDRYFVLGVNLDLSFKKRKVQRTQAEVINDTPGAFFDKPVQSNVKSEEPVVMEEEILAKVRRVSVSVKTKGHDMLTVDQKAAGKIQAENKWSAIEEKMNSGMKNDNLSSKSIKKEDKTLQVNNAIANNKNINLASENSKAGKTSAEKVNKKNEDYAETTIESQNQLNSFSTQLYAIILSNFKDEKEALFIKSKLTAIFNCESVVYLEGEKYLIRIPGFAHKTEAEIFTNKAINSGFKNTFSIITQYNKVAGAMP